jgi:prepilin-type N-terminal cleavage/methylation domain-containing protein
MKKRYDSRNSGFTIVELVIVILVVGILAAIAITKFTSQTIITASLAADMAASDIRAVQHSAMFKGASRSIIFVGGNDYTAEGLTPEDRALPGNASADTYSITFNSFGEPNQGGNFKVSSGGDFKTLTIEALTGKVTIN